MRYATADLTRAATRVLAREAGRERVTSEDLAAASARLLDRQWEHLAQIIGRAGMEALWHRAVKLQESGFPFLDAQTLSRHDSTPGEALRACLREQEPDVIWTASVALFATLGGLLVTIIGDRLAWQLLQGVWPDTRLAEPDPQETQE